MITRTIRFFDDRLGLSQFARRSLDKVFPDNWSFMLGEVAMYCLIVLIATGTYLTLFFRASPHEVVYRGSYAPLRGVHMSEALQSTLRLSWDVRAGLLIRQMHHWAALIFIGAIVAHLCRLFFTGAFRRPREINWIIGLTLFVLALANGFTGYSLPDDLLSGTGLRIAYSILLSIPIIGTWAAFLVFGGEFPADDILSRLFILHVLFIPGLILALLGAHLAILWHQKHTQFPGPGRTEENIVGSRLWPRYALRSLGLFAGVAAVVALLGGLVQINPVWLYGPFHPAAVSTAAQPDWYIGWLEGALRLFPPFRLHVFGFTISELFWPGVVLPGATFGVLYGWPFLEARFTGDLGSHHLLDRPRDRPVRTALGVSALSFYAVLLVAGGQDLLAQHLRIPLATVTTALRVAVFVVPACAGALAAKMCRDLQRGDDHRRQQDLIRAGVPGSRRPTAKEDHPVRRDGPHRSMASRAIVGAIIGAAVVADALSRHRGRAPRRR